MAEAHQVRAKKPRAMPAPVVTPLDANGFSVTSICCSPDGRWVVGTGPSSGHRQAAILLWDAGTLELKKVRKLPAKAHALSPRFSADGSLLATARSPDSLARLWEVPSLKPVATLPLIPAGARPNRCGIVRDSTMVADFAFSPDGKSLAAGCWDTHVKIWALGDGILHEFVPGHSGNVDFVAWVAGGKRLISGTNDVLRVWDVKRRKVLKETRLGGEQFMWEHAISQDGRRLVSVGYKGLVRVWEVGAPRARQFSIDVKRRHTVCALSPDGETLALVSESRRIVLRDLNAGPPRPVAHRFARGITSLAWSADGKGLICLTHAPPPGSGDDSLNEFHVRV